jgi:hypothetical protein
MSAIWRSTTIIWKEPQSWVPPISRWLSPSLAKLGVRQLQKLGEQELCWDDPDWLKITQSVLLDDVECVIREMGDVLAFATVRTYHGCRTKDADSYHRFGIRCNDPDFLVDETRQIVAEEDGLAFMRDSIEQRLARFDGKDSDTGRVYLGLDDRGLIEFGGHYLLYGSEWIQRVLGFKAHYTLLQRGTPTIIVVDLPLSVTRSTDREHLARHLLQEWTRIKVNRPDWSPKVDFSFCLRRDVPPEMVVGHSHPQQIRDPLHGNIVRHSPSLHCLACRPVN